MLDTDLPFAEEHMWPLQHINSNRKSQQSDVVRRVNSGFEILYPGTFDSLMQSQDITDAVSDLDDGSKRAPKKLHKKNLSTNNAMRVNST